MVAAPVATQCREIVAGGPAAAARHWTGPTVGCFPVYSPFEIYHASGALPVGLFGAGGSVELTHADARFQSFVCSVAKSTLELGFQKKLEGLGGVIFHSICDVARNLASLYKRNFPDLYVDYVHLPQNSGSAASEDYAVAELARVRDNVGRWTKKKPDNEALLRSIRSYNRTRAQMRELYALRAASPERVSASELYLLVRAGTLLPPAAHADLLRQALEEARAREGKRMDRVRVVVEGAFCEQPPLGLIDVIERAGCYIVDDDFVAGWRWFLEDVEEKGDPLRALARAYLKHSRPSSTRHDAVIPRHEELAARVKRLGAQAVVFMPAKFCEPALFDYALHRRVLDREGIPHLLLEFEEKMWTFDRARNEIETFAESILFD